MQSVSVSVRLQISNEIPPVDNPDWKTPIVGTTMCFGFLINDDYSGTPKQSVFVIAKKEVRQWFSL